MGLCTSFLFLNACSDVFYKIEQYLKFISKVADKQTASQINQHINYYPMCKYYFLSFENK